VSHHLLAWSSSTSAGLVLALLLCCTGAGAFVGLATRGLDRHQHALLLDRALETEELLITALHLGEDDLAARDRLLGELELEDGAIRRAIPVRWPRHARWLGLPVIGLAVILALPPWRPAAPEARTALSREGETLQTRMEEASEDGAILPPDLEREIADLATEMREETLDIEEALDRIDEIQSQLASFDETLTGSEDLLDELEQAAQALTAEDTQELADALRQGDLAGAADAAEDLAEHLAERSDPERQAIGEDLQRAGEALAGSDNAALRQVGQGMQEAGEQLTGTGQRGSEDANGGNPDLTPEQIRDLSEQLAQARELGEQLQRDQRALDRSQRLSGAMESSSERLGGDSEVASGTSSQEGGEADSEAGDNGQASLPGRRHTWEDESAHARPTTSPTGDRNNDATDGQVIDDYERLYEPVRSEGSEALLASVPGDLDERGRIDTLETRLTGADEDARGAQLDIPAQYRDAAAEAMNNESIPPAYRDTVKQYFDEMEGR